MVSHYELDAKLEAQEARAEARIARIEAKIDQSVASSSEANASLKSLKSTLIVTAIGSVLTIVIGVAAFNATLLSNMLASFESGKNTSSMVSEVASKQRQIDEKLQAIQDRLDAAASAAATSARTSKHIKE